MAQNPHSDYLSHSSQICFRVDKASSNFIYLFQDSVWRHKTASNTGTSKTLRLDLTISESIRIDDYVEATVYLHLTIKTIFVKDNKEYSYSLIKIKTSRKQLGAFSSEL